MPRLRQASAERVCKGSCCNAVHSGTAYIALPNRRVMYCHSTMQDLAPLSHSDWVPVTQGAGAHANHLQCPPLAPAPADHMAHQVPARRCAYHFFCSASRVNRQPGMQRLNQSACSPPSPPSAPRRPPYQVAHEFFSAIFYNYS